jgi:hypothetical protein
LGWNKNKIPRNNRGPRNKPSLAVLVWFIAIHKEC